MKTPFLYILPFLSFLFFNGQLPITGYVTNAEISKGIKEVSLYEITLINQDGVADTNMIAKTQLLDNGFFTFDSSLFDNRDRIYQIRFTDENKTAQSFILSSEDSVRFMDSNIPFANFSTDNIADKEWRRLKKHVNSGKTNLDKESEARYQAFLKDSLEILLVKLIGINQLHEKNLLDKDIRANLSYYKGLIKECRNSELDPVDYAHLESRCIEISEEVLTSKYYTSMIINGLLLMIILGLFTFIWMKRKNRKEAQPIAVLLSNQEKVIHDLIAQGKSNKEIAAELFVSLSTVKTHITNLYSKMGISSRKEIQK